MPRLDGKGPRGEGAKTGRGLGKCNDSKTVEVNSNNNVPHGLGRGQGNGRKQPTRQNINRGNR